MCHNIDHPISAQLNAASSNPRGPGFSELATMRRVCLHYASMGLGWLALAGLSSCPNTAFAAAPKGSSVEGEPVLSVKTDPAHALIPFLSWDTEGGNRTQMNLLRAPVELRVQSGGQWRSAKDLSTRRELMDDGNVRYHLVVAAEADLVWEIRHKSGGLTMVLAVQGAGATGLDQVEIHFPFNPLATATTVLPSGWEADGRLRPPAILSAPDFGQMLLTTSPPPGWKIRLEGIRASRSRPDPKTTDAAIDVVLELASMATGQSYTAHLTPVILPTPNGIQDEGLWRMARRGWFNIFQVSARWGDQQDAAKGSPAGVWANNVISDPVSGLLYLLGDHALLLSQLAPDVPATGLVRHTVDWWLDHRSNQDGNITLYGRVVKLIALDANAAPLIAAWDYVEATGDRDWLARRIERLELTADLLARCNQDADGLVESPSGLSAYDVVHVRHKDLYCNALVYRAWRSMADLETKLGRTAQQDRYTQLADRLKADFFPTFYNPATGWLAWWKTPDGKLHDYASPGLNGLAIEYGLVEPAQGRAILARLWKKIDEVGFKRFELGVPVTLVPIRAADYVRNLPLYSPQREDGADTFGIYLNGGCTVNDTIHFLVANYMIGESEKADRILRAMLERQDHGAFPNGGGFQNGIVNRDGFGAEFFTWEGKPCGYEGYLVYSFSFMQAVFLRQTEFRTRIYRPLKHAF